MDILLFLVFSSLRGLNAIAMKMAQKDRIKSFHDSIFFTIIFSSFQLFFLFLIPPWTGYSFRPEVFLFPVCFGLFFFVSNVFLLRALHEGPTSLTNIIYSFQAIIPIIVSLILWHEAIGSWQILGLVLFVIVLFLFNQGSYSDGQAENKKVTLKWIILAGISTMAAGIAVIFTKEHMLKFDGLVKEYLMIYNAVVVLLGLPYLLLTRKKQQKSLLKDKKFLAFTASPGLMTDITNMIYMFFITRFQSAFFFPFMSVLNILSVVILSRLLLKEKISKPAYAGIVLSFLAIYLLGIK